MANEGVPMVTSTSDEIRIGPPAIRFLLGSEASGGSVAVFRFHVPAEPICQSLGGDSRVRE
jgi:hypothetical protein